MIDLLCSAALQSTGFSSMRGGYPLLHMAVLCAKPWSRCWDMLWTYLILFTGPETAAESDE